MSAPATINGRMVAWQELRAAQCRGVLPRLVRARGSAPASMRRVISAASALVAAASCRGVILYSGTTGLVARTTQAPYASDIVATSRATTFFKSNSPAEMRIQGSGDGSNSNEPESSTLLISAIRKAGAASTETTWHPNFGTIGTRRARMVQYGYRYCQRC